MVTKVLEVRKAWDRSFEWRESDLNFQVKANPVYDAICLLLETNDTVSLSYNDNLDTLIFREKKIGANAL